MTPAPAGAAGPLPRSGRSGPATCGERGQRHGPRAGLACSCGLLLALGAGPAYAVGLGRIEITSSLNQRLDARIPVHQLEGHPIESVDVGLAPIRIFRELGIQYRRDLGQLEFALERDPGGGHVIRVRSQRPVSEPFISFVLELDWPAGRMIRDYTVLVDPPARVAESFALDGNAEAKPTTGQNKPAAEPGTASATTERESAPAAEAEPAPEAAAAAPDRSEPAAGDRYGPVPRGSSAWRVAEAVRHPGTSIYQTMIALLRANPQAFEDGDLGRLEAGVMLDIPSPEAVAAIPHQRAVALYRQHLEPAAGADTGTVADAAAEPAEPDSSEIAGVDAGTGATDESPGEAGAFDSISAHASEPEGLSAARDAAAPDLGPRVAELRADVDELETTLGQMLRRDRAAPPLATLERRVDEALAARDGQVADLREELATVREELAAVRGRSDEPVQAALGGAGWMAGLAAFLGFLFGAVGGVLGARHFVMRRMEELKATAAAAYESQRSLDELLGDAEESPWEEAETEIPPMRHRPPELNENRPAIGVEEDALADERDDLGHPGGDDAGDGDHDRTTEDRPDAGDGDAGETAPEAAPAGDEDTDIPAQQTDGESADEEMFFDDAETEHSSDFYHSLAKLYLEAGWPNDVEELLREVILRNGDEPIYRALILEAMYQLGDSKRFLEEFEAYQAIAGADDPSRGWILEMGGRLCPDRPEFGSGEAAPETSANVTPDAGLEPGDLDTPGSGDEEIVFEIDENEFLEGDDLDLDHPETFGSEVELDEPEGEPEDFPQLTSVEGEETGQTSEELSPAEPEELEELGAVDEAGAEDEQPKEEPLFQPIDVAGDDAEDRPDADDAEEGESDEEIGGEPLEPLDEVAGTPGEDSGDRSAEDDSEEQPEEASDEPMGADSEEPSGEASDDATGEASGDEPGDEADEDRPGNERASGAG